jgi:RNA polymerase sigma-70 factor (ECF subfamily)
MSERRDDRPGASERPSSVPPDASVSSVGDAPPAPSPHAGLAQALERHFALVWRSLRRFGVPTADIDDAAQQVFLALSARLGEVPPEKERAFLVAACFRVAANERRRAVRRRDRATEAIERHADEAPGPEELYDTKQRRVAHDQALATLTLDQRTVFVLFELEGFSLPEIAESLDIPLGTATSRLRRARAHLEAWVEQRLTGGTT